MRDLKTSKGVPYLPGGRPGHKPNGGGKYCCSGCRNAPDGAAVTHDVLCHKIPVVEKEDEDAQHFEAGCVRRKAWLLCLNKNPYHSNALTIPPVLRSFLLNCASIHSDKFERYRKYVNGQVFVPTVALEPFQSSLVRFCWADDDFDDEGGASKSSSSSDTAFSFRASLGGGTLGDTTGDPMHVQLLGWHTFEGRALMVAGEEPEMVLPTSMRVVHGSAGEGAEAEAAYGTYDDAPAEDLNFGNDGLRGKGTGKRRVATTTSTTTTTGTAGSGGTGTGGTGTGTGTALVDATDAETAPAGAEDDEVCGPLVVECTYAAGLEIVAVRSDAGRRRPFRILFQDAATGRWRPARAANVTEAELALVATAASRREVAS